MTAWVLHRANHAFVFPCHGANYAGGGRGRMAADRVAGSPGGECQHVRFPLGQPARQASAIEPLDIRLGAEFAVDGQRGRRVRAGDTGLT